MFAVSSHQRFSYLVKTESYTEEQLVTLLKQHDEAAFRFLYDNYSKALFTIVYQMIPQQEAAEDLLQQVFVKIWKNMAMYDESKGRLFTWMLNIARNQAIDFTRSKEFNQSGKTGTLSESVYDYQRTNASVSDTGLKKVLERLPSENRNLLDLSYFKGYSHKEISDILGLPLGTVKTRLRNIIIELRKIMEIS